MLSHAVSEGHLQSRLVKNGRIELSTKITGVLFIKLSTEGHLNYPTFELAQTASTCVESAIVTEKWLHV